MTGIPAPAALPHNDVVATAPGPRPVLADERVPPAAPLRVAFCIDNMNVGGTELNALRTARELVARGVALSVFCLSGDGPLVARYAELGVPVEFLPIGGLYGWRPVRYGTQLMRRVRQAGIQVVHAHDFYSNIFAGPWARLGGAAFVASRRWWAGPERRGQRWANRASYILADRVLANSEAVAGLLRSHELVRAGAIRVVPNFLDDAHFEPPPAGWAESHRAELDLPDGAEVIGVLASLQPIKDHATLLRAFGRIAAERPGVHLVLVGADGGSRADLERQAAQLGAAGRVRFAGLRPNLPSPHWLFDISVLTSVSEGLPNTVLEAMAAGRPVVATRVGAMADAVVDGETGALVPVGDDRALARALLALLGDPRRRRSLGEAGRRRARQRYSVSAAMGSLLDLYRGVAPARGEATSHG